MTRARRRYLLLRRPARLRRNGMRVNLGFSGFRPRDAYSPKALKSTVPSFTHSRYGVISQYDTPACHRPGNAMRPTSEEVSRHQLSTPRTINDIGVNTRDRSRWKYGAKRAFTDMLLHRTALTPSYLRTNTPTDVMINGKGQHYPQAQNSTSHSPGASRMRSPSTNTP